jgi:hypothetical protein
VSSKYEFIDGEKALYPIVSMCRCRYRVPASTSGCVTNAEGSSM